MSSAFDPVAAMYDGEFTATPIGRLLRAAVHARLETRFRAPMRVLELGCGTGEDAVMLAARGVRVVATDASDAMLAVTRAKAERFGVAHLIETHRLDLNAPRPAAPWGICDGVLSNFGALNCVADLRALFRRLAGWTAVGARCVLVVMGPFCPWEIVWYVAHLKPRTAFRRWARGGLLANIGGNRVRVWYPSAGRLAQNAVPHFQLKHVGGLGVFVPPPYTTIAHGLALAALLDRALARWFPLNQCGDHYIAELERH